MKYIHVFLATTSIYKLGNKPMYEKGQCQTDIFSVTSPGNNAPPVICGTNTGEHSKLKLLLNILQILFYFGIFSVCGFIRCVQ